MLHEAIPSSVAALLKDSHNWQLPATTYLAGGTAVAIYLNHRISVDIDLFTDEEFYCGPIISSLGRKHTITVTNLAEKDTMIAIVDNVRVSLFHYPYPLLKPLVNSFEYKISLASPKDIAAMKIVAITQRGIAKDFVDLRMLLIEYKLSLDDLLSQVQKKYGVSQEYGYQVKKSLVYFDDAIKSLGDVTVVKEGKGVRLEKNEWYDVENFFKKIVLGK